MLTSAVRLTGAMVLVLASPLSVAPQTGAQPSADLRVYARIVARYRAGEFDAAVQELIARDRPSIERALADLPSSPDWTTPDIEAAVLLHTDAALGTAYQIDFHLGAAEHLIGLDDGRRLGTGFQREWYLAVAGFLQRAFRLEEAAPHLDQMAKRFPRDGEVLLALGSFYEALGWSRQSPIDLTPASIGPRGGPSSTEPRPQILEGFRGRNQRGIQEVAVSTFRKALAASPALDEARLRLARLLNDLDQPGEALELLMPLREESAGVDLRYLAAMFSGAALQREAKPSAAVDAYRVATMLFPNCQTPWIALSDALRAIGARSAAVEIVQRTAAAGPDCQDPWWNYRSELNPGQAESLLARLRKEIAQ